MLHRALAQRAQRLASSPSMRTALRSSNKGATTALLARPQTTVRLASHIHQPPLKPSSTSSTSFTSINERALSTDSDSPDASTAEVADARIEDITELYATAQDEFEIAMEETEKGTVYAEDDRQAAREELEKVLAAYRAVVEGEDRELAEEVRRRIGHRVRELEMGVVRMEEMAMEHD